MEASHLRKVLDAIDATLTEAVEVASQAVVDDLSEALANSDSFGILYSEGVRRLRGLCRKTNLVPTSCRVSRDIIETTADPIRSHFSDVYTGVLDGRKVAIKVLRVHRDQLEDVRKAYFNELVVWKCLRCPNVVPFIGTSPRSDISLVSEWMPGGTVSAFLRNNPGHDRSALILDVMDGLAFMHSLDVVHGDLRAANILVDGNDRARITDFGLAVVIYATMTSTTSSGGSLRWMAPELLDPDQYVLEVEEEDMGRATKQSDMYALALTTWEIFSGCAPFAEVRDFRVMVIVVGGERPPRLPECTARGLNDGIWAWMVQCWHASPSARPPLPSKSSLAHFFTDAEGHSTGPAPVAQWTDAHFYRMRLNNWLQDQGGSVRLSWDAPSTGPQQGVVVSAFIDGTKYAIGMGRTQGIAKEVAARETLRILEAKWQRTVVMGGPVGGADSVAPSAPIPSPPPFPSLKDVIHINPALRRPNNLSFTALPLLFDIALPTFSASLAPSSPSNLSPLPSTVLSEDAFYPLPVEITIMFASVPWPLEVVVPPPGLSAHDLLRQMYRKLVRPVPAEMLAMCPADMQARARATHRARLRGDPADTTMRRFDFLAGATRFAGLRPLRGTAFEAIFVTPGEAPANVRRFEGGRDTASGPDQSSTSGHDHRTRASSFPAISQRKLCGGILV